MKQEMNLSIKEIETLCLLYNECRLSVQEETELEYILLCTAYSSDIINETKELMGLSRQMKLANDTSARHRRTPLQKALIWTLSAAASVAVILTGSVFLSKINEMGTSTGDSHYVAYVKGKQVDEKTARKIAETEAAKVEEFMQAIERQKAAEQNKVKQFFNNQNSKR